MVDKIEAKDTVMSWERMRIILHDKTKEHQDSMFRIEAVCKAQAKISFNLRTDDILKQLRGFNQRGLTITEAIELLR